MLDYFAALIFSLPCFDILNLERHDLLLVRALLDGVAVLFFLIRARYNLALSSVEGLRVHLGLRSLVHVTEVPMNGMRGWNLSIIPVVLRRAERLTLYFINVKLIALQAAVREERSFATLALRPK